MSNRTKISWATDSWNPATGCTKISPGCLNCYAWGMAQRQRGRNGYDADDPFAVTAETLTTKAASARNFALQEVWLPTEVVGLLGELARAAERLAATCPECDGTGEIWARPCAVCGPQRAVLAKLKGEGS